MMSDKNPVKAMTYLCDLQLFNVVFLPPDNPQPLGVEGCDRFSLSCIDAAWSLLLSVASTIFNDEQCRLYLYGSFFLPFRKTVHRRSLKRVLLLAISSEIPSN